MPNDLEAGESVELSLTDEEVFDGSTLPRERSDPHEHEHEEEAKEARSWPTTDGGSAAPTSFVARGILAMLVVCAILLGLLLLTLMRSQPPTQLGTPQLRPSPTDQSLLARYDTQLQSVLRSLARPWLPDCSPYYQRTPREQQTILAQADARHARALNHSGEEITGYVAELDAALGRHNQNWEMALRDFLLPQLDSIGYKARPVNLECTTHAVVIIETRFTNLDFIVRHTFWMLEQDSQQWGLILFYGKDNGPQIVEAFEIWPGGAGEHIQLHQLTMDINRNVGNQLALSSDFWAMVPVENVLLLQTDGIMLRPPSTNLTMWHEFTNNYAYVGAPLPHAGNGNGGWWGVKPHTPYAGNGGMTFRKKSIMLEFSRTLKCPRADVPVGECHFEQQFPLTGTMEKAIGDEDRWIGWMLYEFQYRYRSQIPLEVMKYFAVDMVYTYPDPFFSHKFWQVTNPGNRPMILTLHAATKAYYVSDDRAAHRPSVQTVRSAAEAEAKAQAETETKKAK